MIKNPAWVHRTMGKGHSYLTHLGCYGGGTPGCGGSRLLELKVSGCGTDKLQYQDSEFGPRPRLINLVIMVCYERGRVLTKNDVDPRGHEQLSRLGLVPRPLIPASARYIISCSFINLIKL